MPSESLPHPLDASSYGLHVLYRAVDCPSSVLVVVSPIAGAGGFAVFHVLPSPPISLGLAAPFCTASTPSLAPALPLPNRALLKTNSSRQQLALIHRPLHPSSRWHQQTRAVALHRFLARRWASILSSSCLLVRCTHHPPPKRPCPPCRPCPCSGIHPRVPSSCFMHNRYCVMRSA